MSEQSAVSVAGGREECIPILDTSAFNLEGTVPCMNDYSIVHLVTHAAFVTGQPEDLFYFNW